MYGIIDIGSGSIKASVYKKEGAAQYLDVGFCTQDFRLIDQNTKKISVESQTRAFEILKNLLSFIKTYSSTARIICIATASLRSAKNASEFIEAATSILNLHINVLTGEQEAALIADSVHSVEQLDKFFSFDIGGGSIEFNIFDRALRHSTSRNIGIINVANKLKQNGQSGSLENIRKIVQPELTEILRYPNLSGYPLICTGGSSIIAEEILQEKGPLSYEIIKKFYETVHHASTDERLQLGIPLGKIDIFDIALGIALIMLDGVNQHSVIVSRANVRHGAAINHKMFDN